MKHIAFCPDPGFWFATDERHWYYQYETEFTSYEEAHSYFCNHISEFVNIQKELRCPFYSHQISFLPDDDRGEFFDIATGG
jgi:hypothetical protein